MLVVNWQMRAQRTSCKVMVVTKNVPCAGARQRIESRWALLAQAGVLGRICRCVGEQMNKVEAAD